jgi:hypothetical protein
VLTWQAHRLAAPLELGQLLAYSQTVDLLPHERLGAQSIGQIAHADTVGEGEKGAGDYFEWTGSTTTMRK